mmetsp:Transcript_16030/g.23686  ORF Transcript_16030/g.23686 Transcript_16030/m.23686 type:complete len:127 (-) Transcript_16030:220-600(-)
MPAFSKTSTPQQKDKRKKASNTPGTIMNQKRQQRNRDSRCHFVVSSERHKQSDHRFLWNTIVEPGQTIPRCSKARTLPSISDRPFLPPMAFGVFGLAFRGGHDACGKVFSPTDQLAVGPRNFTIQL